MPADILKMDGSFVRRLGNDTHRGRAYEIAESIIDLAHRLNLKVIAEAVETVGQLTDLQFMRCDEAQGYLFNRSLHPDKVALLLECENVGTRVVSLMETFYPHLTVRIGFRL